MSHFTVLVIGENPEAQLAPFDENIEVARYIEKDKQKLIEEAKKHIDIIKINIEEYQKEPEKYAEKIQTAISKLQELEKMTDEELYKKALENYDKKDIENGCVMSTYNPKSKWDWYQLGGRWCGYFRIKEEVVRGERTTRVSLGQRSWIGFLGGQTIEEFTADQCEKWDIDFEFMGKQQKERLEKEWEELQKFKSLDTTDDEKNRIILKFWGEEEKLQKAYFSKEEYVEYFTISPISTFAVLKDGKWYERGDMGWFGCVSDEKSVHTWDKEFKKLIDELPDDTLLSLYDCHI